MNKEKTAMQVLFDLIDSEVVRLSKVKGEHKKASEDCATQLVILKMKAKGINLLQKEQEQIENAFDDGYLDGLGAGTGIGELKYSNEGYYQSKYGG